MLSSPEFIDQVPVEFIFCGYPLLVPSKHPMLDWFRRGSGRFQPYRERGMVNVVRSLEQQGRTGTAIDIGANVGDTCAIIHRHSSLRILSIDASEFFFSYLSKNIARHFKSRAAACYAYVLADAAGTPKGLVHRGGTAQAVDVPGDGNCEAIAITDLISDVGQVALLKVDIDGYDIEIISSLIERNQANPEEFPRFPIYFEFELTSGDVQKLRETCDRALSFFRKAAASGYWRAFLWDDPGRFFGLIDLRDRLSLINIMNYMSHTRHRPVWGFDICLVHESDTDLAAELCRTLSGETVMQVTLDQIV